MAAGHGAKWRPRLCVRDGEPSGADSRRAHALGTLRREVLLPAHAGRVPRHRDAPPCKARMHARRCGRARPGRRGRARGSARGGCVSRPDRARGGRTPGRLPATPRGTPSRMATARPARPCSPGRSSTSPVRAAGARCSTCRRYNRCKTGKLKIGERPSAEAVM